MSNSTESIPSKDALKKQIEAFQEEAKKQNPLLQTTLEIDKTIDTASRNIQNIGRAASHSAQGIGAIAEEVIKSFGKALIGPQATITIGNTINTALSPLSTPPAATPNNLQK